MHWVCQYFAVKPRFKIKPMNTTVGEGSPVWLHCSALGDPLPTVHWDKNNRVDALDLQRFKVIIIIIIIIIILLLLLLLLGKFIKPTNEKISVKMLNR